MVDFYFQTTFSYKFNQKDTYENVDQAFLKDLFLKY